MLKIALVGTPNCGKSTIFNALTGGNAKTGNWHGVTMGMEGRAVKGNKACMLYDLAGLYSFNSYSQEESFTKRKLEEEDFDGIFFLMDALSLERCLHLLDEVQTLHKNICIIITMIDLLEKRGGMLQVDSLAERLQLPIFAINTHNKKDVEKLLNCLQSGRFPTLQDMHLQKARMQVGQVRPIQTVQNSTENLQEQSILLTDKSTTKNTVELQSEGRQKADVEYISKPPAYSELAATNSTTGHGIQSKEILQDIYNKGAYKEGKLAKVLYNSYLSLPIFTGILLIILALAFAPYLLGDFLKSCIEYFFEDLVAGRWLLAIFGGQETILYAFLSNIVTSIGGLLAFVPQIAILFFALNFLEESGYISTLAFMTDGFFQKIGLTGRTVFSILMGFGCTAVAVLTTRGLENKEIQKRTIAIMPYIACSAKLPILTAIAASFFPNFSFLTIIAMYFGGVLLALVCAIIVKKVYKTQEEFVLELANLQMPKWKILFKNVGYNCLQFIKKIMTLVLAFLMLMWLLSNFTITFQYVGEGGEGSMLYYIGQGFKVLFYPMGIFDWRITVAAISGIIAKENVAGMLTQFFGDNLAGAMTWQSAIAFTVFMMTVTPCVTAIASVIKELGFKTGMGFTFSQLGIAFVLSYIAYWTVANWIFALVFWTLVAAAIIVYNILQAKRKQGKKCKKSS